MHDVESVVGVRDRVRDGGGVGGHVVGDCDRADGLPVGLGICEIVVAGAEVDGGRETLELVDLEIPAPPVAVAPLPIDAVYVVLAIT